MHRNCKKMEKQQKMDRTEKSQKIKTIENRRIELHRKWVKMERNCTEIENCQEWKIPYKIEGNRKSQKMEINGNAI